MSIKHNYRVKIPKGKLPTEKEPRATLVAFNKHLRTLVPLSPHYNDDPAIKTTFDKWSLVVDELDASGVTLGQIRASEETQLSLDGQLHSQYFTCGDAFMTTLSSVFVNNLAAFQSFAVPMQGPRGPAPVAVMPVNLRANPLKGQPGSYRSRWKGEPGAGIYELEGSPGPAPPAEASFALLYSGKSPSFVGTGQVGQMIWLRVRAKGNQVSPWTSPLAYVIR